MNTIKDQSCGAFQRRKDGLGACHRDVISLNQQADLP